MGSISMFSLRIIKYDYFFQLETFFSLIDGAYQPKSSVAVIEGFQTAFTNRIWEIVKGNGKGSHLKRK